MSKSGIVYKLCCVDTDITEEYIGSTKNFDRRRSEHKNVCNKDTYKIHNLYVYQFIRANGGWQNWRMIQLEVVNYDTKRDLEAHERRWIELLKPKLNKLIPGRTRQEYRIDNADTLLEKHRQYNKDNADKIKQYAKQYCRDNADKLKEKRKTQILCNCGKTLTKKHTVRHQKTKNHIFWETQNNYIYS